MSYTQSLNSPSSPESPKKPSWMTIFEFQNIRNTVLLSYGPYVVEVVVQDCCILGVSYFKDRKIFCLPIPK